MVFIFLAAVCGGIALVGFLKPDPVHEDWAPIMPSVWPRWFLIAAVLFAALALLALVT